MKLRAVAISGSPRSPSKSRLLAEMLLDRMRAGGGVDGSVIDLAMLPADALVARVSAPDMDHAIAEVGAAQIVIAATPTYRALYTGVLKAFFDLMPPAHLLGKICVPVQTGGSPAHLLSIEYGLRPLFASLEGESVAGVYAWDEQFVDGQPVEALAARITRVAASAVDAALARAG